MKVKSIGSLQFFTLILLSLNFFSCSKAKDDTAAGRARGSYKGSMWIGGVRHLNYFVKVDFVRKDKIKLSCLTEPKAFDSFEIEVLRAGGGAHSQDLAKSVDYYDGDPGTLLVSIINLQCSYLGDKQ